MHSPDRGRAAPGVEDRLGDPQCRESPVEGEQGGERRRKGRPEAGRRPAEGRPRGRVRGRPEPKVLQESCVFVLFFMVYHIFGSYDES